MIKHPVLVFILCVSAALSAAPKQDGIISPGEYPHTASFGDGKFILNWSMDARSIYFGIDAESPGWVAVGLDPVTVMDKADMVFGAVDKNGRAKTMDAFCTGVFGPHPDDVSLGGTNDIRRAEVKRSGGRVVFEFTRRLETKDKFDKPIRNSTDLKLIWACGESADFESHHVKAGSEIINLSSGEQSIVKSSSPYYLVFHVGFMTLALVFMASAFAFARFYRKKKWWLYMHKAFGGAAVVSAAAGIASIFVYLSGIGADHFESPHSIAGAVVFCLSIAAIVLGMSILKTKGNKRVKFIHRWTGRTTLLFMLVNAIGGLFLLGIL